jgi:small subunit ribosomal protein S27Ae|tara:strand:+ start:694 stop:1269 length:576 start_codon:yes stop_codon:yes gene_type:complete
VGDLKRLIQLEHSRLGCSVDDMRLMFPAGRPLNEDDRTLEDYNITKGSNIVLMGNLRGGHCQVPCGIFDDPAMVAEIKEACATIRKAVAELHKPPPAGDAAGLVNHTNQSVRWVMTKEEHCCKIITKIAEYCLCQRVKPEVFAKPEDYVDALKAHHAVMQTAMKAKQSATEAAVDALDHAVGDFAKMYVKD